MPGNGPAAAEAVVRRRQPPRPSVPSPTVYSIDCAEHAPATGFLTLRCCCC
jgi:hypothetical protein